MAVPSKADLRAGSVKSSTPKRPLSGKALDSRQREQRYKEYEELLEELKKEFDDRWARISVGHWLSTNGSTLDDFERFRTLGTGAYGRVMLAKHKKDSKYYAMKVLDKTQLVKLKQVFFLSLVFRNTL